MLTGNEVALFLSGLPVPLKECNIAITPPTINDIVVFGEENFFIALEMVTHFSTIGDKIRAESGGKNELANISDFQLLLVMIQEDPESRAIVDGFFSLVLPNYTPQYDDADITFLTEVETTDSEGHHTKVKRPVGQIRDYNFENFTELLRKMLLPSALGKQEEEYNPSNDAAAEIAEKLRRGKEKLAAMKSSKGEEGSLFGTFISILAIGLPMNIQELYRYTPFQLFDLVARYWAKMESDFYQKIATTPLMDVSNIDEPKEWFRNLYS